jgi:hypothetical protein
MKDVTRRYSLLNHPSAEKIGGQIAMADDNDEKFGEYMGTPLEASIEVTPEIMIEVIEIAPRKMESIAELGGIAVTGRTKENRFAFVIIKPLSEDGTLGAIYVD